MRRIREFFSVKITKAPALVVLLAILIANLVFISIAAIVIMRLAPPSLENNDYWSCVYYAATMLATGYMEIVEVSETGVLLILFCMFTVLIGMIVFTGAVIGYVTEFIASFIEDADTGQRKLLISDHIVILNWNSRASEIINELLYKNDREKIVILVDDNKEDVLNDIDERIADTIDDENEATKADSQQLKYLAGKRHYRQNKLKNKLTIIVREGETWSTKQLSDISIEYAKTVIILGNDIAEVNNSFEYDDALEQKEKGNTNTIRTLLQVTYLTAEENPENNQLVVVEVENDWTLTLVEIIISQKRNQGSCRVVPVATNQILGQIFSLFAIMPELNIVYGTLFSNKGAGIYVESSDEYTLTEEEFITEYLSNHQKTLPLTVIHDEDGKYYRYYMSENEQSISTATDVDDTSVRLSVNPDYQINDKHVIILGHNSKSIAIMEGFKAFCDEWQTVDSPNLLDITVIDSAENLAKHDEYSRYKFVKNVITADVYDKQLIYSAIESFIDSYQNSGCIIVLSDDTVGDEDIDADVLTYLVFIQEIFDNKQVLNKDFDISSIDLVVEIINPKNYDIISNYCANNIVISNRYISKMILQVGEKEAIYNFFDDVLNYDQPSEDVFVSKEIYVKKVGEYLDLIPDSCTASELIRAIYQASPADNKAITMGYFNTKGEMYLFTGDQSSIEVTLTEDDKLILFSNH
ncbi:MAG: hypothetical protein FWG21_03755 [Oscillospiraceae bacterium]|nr:hypothetical protein [Oscillospiraceae bacterium]